MTTTVHVFNQYYWDLLKKSKNLAKDLKHKASDTHARTILREIKNSYMSFDKSSSEHVEWYKQHVQPGWRAFAEGKTTVELWNKWSEDVADGIATLELYRGISIGTLIRTYKSKDVLLYYLILLSVFAEEHVTTEHVSKILEILRKRSPLEDSEMEFVQDEFVATSVRLLHQMSIAQNATTSSASSNPDRLLSELENTSLGKLAKEIMEDVNISQIQESVGDGDILKAFTDPNGEMSKLIGTVTQKMVSKLASGELRQDTLLSDAMKLAGSLPGGAPGSGMFDQLGKMASMFGGGDGDEEGGFDLASMMKNMMGGGKPPGGGKGTRATVNSSALTRNVKAKQLRRKLEERRKVKENIGTQVGDQ